MLYKKNIDYSSSLFIVQVKSQKIAHVIQHIIAILSLLAGIEEPIRVDGHVFDYSSFIFRYLFKPHM